MKKLIGYGYTNSSGVATMTKDASGSTISGYTGTGAGLMNFRAEMHDDSTVVSQPYNVWDYLMYDDGTNTDDWFDYQNRATRTLETDGVLIENNQTTNIVYYLVNKHGTSHSSISDVTEWGVNDFRCEFELKSATYLNCRFVFNDGAEQVFALSTIGISQPSTIRMESHNGVVSFYVNGTLKSTTVTLNAPFRFGFKLDPSANIKFSEFKVYLI